MSWNLHREKTEKKTPTICVVVANISRLSVLACAFLVRSPSGVNCISIHALLIESVGMSVKDSILIRCAVSIPRAHFQILPCFSCRVPCHAASNSADFDTDAARTGKIDHTRNGMQLEAASVSRGVELGRHGFVFCSWGVEPAVWELEGAGEEAERRGEDEMQRGFGEEAPGEDDEDTWTEATQLIFSGGRY